MHVITQTGYVILYRSCNAILEAAKKTLPQKRRFYPGPKALTLKSPVSLPNPPFRLLSVSTKIMEEILPRRRNAKSEPLNTRQPPCHLFHPVFPFLLVLVFFSCPLLWPMVFAKMDGFDLGCNSKWFPYIDTSCSSVHIMYISTNLPVKASQCTPATGHEIHYMS